MKLNSFDNKQVNKFIFLLIISIFKCCFSSKQLELLNNLAAINIQFKCYQPICYSGLMTFTAFNKQFNLLVNKLITPLPNDEDCYYHGPVNASNEWMTISLTNCGNIFEGFIINSEHIYQIFYNESSNNHFIKIIKPNGNIIPRDFVKENDSMEQQFDYKANETLFEFRNKPVSTRFLVFNVDCYYNKALIKWTSPHGDFIKLFKRIFKYVNSIWSRLGIIFSISRLTPITESWTKNNGTSMESDLKDFSKFIYSKIRSNESSLQEFEKFAVFIYFAAKTSSELPDNTVGMAYLGGICSMNRAYVVSSFTPYSEFLAFYIMAHELGHSLGLQHNIQTCFCPAQVCLMDPVIGGIEFSSCSVRLINNFIAKGRYTCATDKPISISSASCGNGIIEDDEECDCVETSCQHCCLFCQIIKGNCGSGDCCDYQNCQLIAADEYLLCRPTKSSCDIHDYCDGVSQLCPDNAIKPDFTECSGRFGTGYCVDGECGTYEDSCYELFTSEIPAPDECFDKNSQGNNEGNCGSLLKVDEKRSRVQCSPDSTRCGLLFCIVPEEVSQNVPNYVSGDSIFHKSKSGEVCRGFEATSSHQLRPKDTSYVADGSPCSLNKACYQQKCVDVNSQRKSQPHCPNQCNGRGDCDKNGTCHCYHLSSNLDCSFTINIANLIFCFFNLTIAILFSYAYHNVPNLRPASDRSEKEGIKT